MDAYQSLHQRIYEIKQQALRKEFRKKIYTIMMHHPEVSKREDLERLVRDGFVIENLPDKYCYRVVTSNDRRVVYEETHVCHAEVAVYYPGVWEGIIEKAYVEAACIEKDKKEEEHQNALEKLRRRARENFGI